MANLIQEQQHALPCLDTTKPINIPNNDLAKVMYYLDCICYCIDYRDRHIQRYTNYTKSSLLSQKEVEAVFLLALKLSPDQLLGKVFFPSDVFNCDVDGKFYEMNQVRHHLVIPPSLMIADRKCQIQNVLAFKESWLIEYYLEPMNRLAQNFRFQHRGKKKSCFII